MELGKYYTTVNMFFFCFLIVNVWKQRRKYTEKPTTNHENKTQTKKKEKIPLLTAWWIQKLSSLHGELLLIG